MTNDYRIFQLTSFLTTKFNYKLINIQGGRAEDVYLYNENDVKFSVIRLTTESSGVLCYNRQNILNIFNLIADNLKLNRNYLNISITHEEIDNNEIFKCSSLFSNHFHSGEALENVYPGILDVIVEVENPENEINKQIRKINEVAKSQLINRFKKYQKNNMPIVTMIMAIISIVIFVAINLLGGDKVVAAIVFGANYKAFVVGASQYYRLFTSTFVHIDILHLFTNLLSLYYLGVMFEKQMGHLKYFIAFIISAIIGNALWIIFNPNGVSLGLSGGLYGLFAMVIILFYERKMLFKNYGLLMIILFNIMLSFSSGIAMMAHFGGAFGGFFMYYLLYKNDVDKTFKQTATISLVVLILSLGVKIFGITNVEPKYSPTDIKVIEKYREFGLKSYADNIEFKLSKFYSGGR
ncbi:MAG: rhomboid family intramembrane serine protease [Erysipelotrichaceae bacterium]|nr:rhomboid family intramembrane serine protease [Erysipelotrichaceae bacterium]